ncbi:GTPase Era [Deferrisoma camini]|uniref:GTPase Era n=1 Tax=Deferrisoma camini TaxID=1035120 RepID=UPI00046CDCC8|nr:GTPase Era [Deferrisoma camini]
MESREETGEIRVTRSGFVGILGRPNVGKSTLLNRILGQKVVITSPKPQTTRNRVAGVLTRDGVQMVFFDTPGVHAGQKLINRYMVREALSCVPDVDVVLFLVDAATGRHPDDEVLAGHLRRSQKPVILVVNKADRNRTAPTEAFQDLVPAVAVHRISALTGEGVEAILDDLASRMPEGPAYYPEDQLTDRPERFLAEEFVREKVFELTGEEIPYSVAVTVEAWEERPEADLVVIHATIHVERPSQKAIVIGKGGRVIKEVGRRARLDLEALLGTRVFLDLHVTVDRNWTKDPRALRRFGYEVRR